MSEQNTIQAVEAQAIVPQETVTPNQMLAMAVQSGADPERLDKLMDLQLKWEANQARKAYTKAMAEFRAKCPTIGRTKDSYNGKYAGLSESISQIKGVMSECGLSHSWKVSQNGVILVECFITHIDGHQESTSMSAPSDASGKKNPIQAIASTVSYLERYTLFAILGLASQEQDDDGNGAIPEAAILEIQPPTQAEAKVLDEIVSGIIGANVTAKQIGDFLWESKRAYPTEDKVDVLTNYFNTKKPRMAGVTWNA